MFKKNKELWVVNIINKIAYTFFFMNIVMFISFFVISHQGISISLADNYLTLITTISIVTIIMLTLMFINIIIKKDKTLKKIGLIFRNLINIFVSIVILIISHSIYVLSTGNMEQIW